VSPTPLLKSKIWNIWWVPTENGKSRTHLCEFQGSLLQGAGFIRLLVQCKILMTNLSTYAIYYVQVHKMCYFIWWPNAMCIIVNVVHLSSSFPISNCLGVVMVEYSFMLGQTKDYRIGICCLSAKQAALRSSNKDCRGPPKIGKKYDFLA
jgi:hypothetical protein